MQIAAGGYINITDPDDMYGISKRDFDDTYKVVEKDKRPYIELEVKNGEKQLFSPEQISGMVLSKMKQIAEEKGMKYFSYSGIAKQSLGVEQ